MKIEHIERWIVGGLILFLFGMVALSAYLVGKDDAPAQINVRCIGDHLLFESERTGDIQVIPNKCKKTYPKSQAPETSK